MGSSMIIFDLFSGTGSATKAFRDAGHTVISFELNPKQSATENVDIMTLKAADLVERYGKPDFIWASPPCTTFSVASCRIYWNPDGTPKSPKVYEALKLVAHTIELMQEINPRHGWLMENPRGMLRKQKVVEGLQRQTITYCQYGDTRMKPTDLWGNVPGWTPRAMCKNGDPCHEPGPRGTASGTQRLRSAVLRSMIAPDLSKELLAIMEGHAENDAQS